MQYVDSLVHRLSTMLVQRDVIDCLPLKSIDGCITVHIAWFVVNMLAVLSFCAIAAEPHIEPR